MNKNTAILVFAQSSTEELKRKAIYKGGKLFNVLNEQTLKTVKSTKLPYILCTEAQQTGNTFAERFVNAISSVYNMGYENVITIGNDSPQLTKKHLLESQQQLEKKNFVLGPTTDGGFYLMGLHKSLFNANAFMQMPWQTSKLTNSLHNFIKSKEVAIVILSTLYDIDTTADLQNIIHRNLYIPLKIKGLVLKIVTFNTLKKQWYFLNNYIQKTYSSNSYNKGSPLISSYPV